MRRSTQSRTLCGVRLSTQLLALMAARTSLRPRRDEPNISSPCDCALRPTAVCVTCRALRDVASATTIMPPAPRRK
ncbi:MAG: hypothetical protein ACI30N_07150 [Muribaculaceae bacterium]